MDLEWLRRVCLSLPHTTEQVQWEDVLVFKVGGRMYAVAQLEPGDVWLSFKCGEEEFPELIERPGVLPAPYLARAHWVALASPEALPSVEIEELLRRAYELVFAKLPRKTQASLTAGKSRRSKSRLRPALNSLRR
ncbi:MAG: MmcQ/YjbR family DNA-binding protein [Acidobacteriota bacterium]|nr:MmcQ/YjbR family DNA-binding protein [Acidobacteriota bacterium]